MITNLYVMFESLGTPADLSKLVTRISVPGYSFSTQPQKQTIRIPGEDEFPVTSFFYAQNDFRIYISHGALEFYRGADIPSELLAGETELYSRILETNVFTVRRWLATSEGWDNDDHPFVNIIATGNSADTFPLLNM